MKWIQPTYSPTNPIEQVLEGTNGCVNDITYNSFDGSHTISGNFTELNALPCLNIGYYKNNQLSCLENGVSGIINDVVNISGNVYAFGELHYNGQIYPIAKYDGTNWSYQAIPNRDSAICTAANFGGAGYQFEIAIGHSIFPQHQEIWHYLNDNTWERQAKVKGTIVDILASNYGRVHTGHFDSVIIYNSSSILDTSFIANNVVINSHFTNQWHGIDGDISDTVNVVIEIGGALIFGGTCANQSGTNNICLSRYFNSVLQPLFLNNSTDYYTVNSIAYDNGNEFTFGGNFNNTPIVGTTGSNLATFNLVNNNIVALASLDQPVNSLSFINGTLYIGGSFQTNLGVQSINYLARLGSSIGINESSADMSINVYPNPFISTINLEGFEKGFAFSILNIEGRTVKKGTTSNGTINDLDIFYLKELICCKLKLKATKWF